MDKTQKQSSPERENKKSGLTAPREKELIKKGMSYEACEKELAALKRIARNQGLSLPKLVEKLSIELEQQHKAQLIERCSGDEELAQSILDLEEKVKGKKDGEMDAVTELFPEISSVEQLPAEAVIAARERNTALIDEYLRFLARSKKLRSDAALRSKKAKNASVGSQKDRDISALDPVRNEFIKGIWGE